MSVEVRQEEDTPSRRLFHVNPPVFWTSVGLIAFFVIVVLLGHDDAEAIFAAAQDRIATGAG